MPPMIQTIGEITRGKIPPSSHTVPRPLLTHRILYGIMRRKLREDRKHYGTSGCDYGNGVGDAAGA